MNFCPHPIHLRGSIMSQASAVLPQHDAQGRFAAGNRGGPGNPYGQRVALLRGAFLDALQPEDIRAVALALLLKAQSGDLTAAKLLLQYSLGKPIAHLPPGNNDDAETRDPERLEEMLSNIPTAELTSLLDGAPASPPKPMSKAERKAMYREMRRQRREKTPSANGSNGAQPATTPIDRPSDAKPPVQPLRAG
jgi:hypothetical protein